MLYSERKVRKKDNKKMTRETMIIYLCQLSLTAENISLTN